MSQRTAPRRAEQHCAGNKPTRAELAAIKKRFDWLLDPVRSLRRNPWPLLREPTTYMARLREKMEHAFKQRLAEVGEERFVRDLVGVGVSRRVLLDGFAKIADHLRDEERAVAKLPAGTGILGLLGAADARVRNSPLIAFLNLKLMLGASRLGPMGQVHLALKERGETRARMMLRAVADISEELYRPYLVEVWNLTEFAEGRVPRRPGRFGRLVEDLGERLSGVEGIVEPLALNLRNAVDHNHYEYVPRTKSLVLWNASDSWRDEATVDHLKFLAEWLLTVAGTTFPRASQWFMQDALLRSGLWSVLMKVLPALERSDRAELDVLGREIEARTQGMYVEIARLFAASKGGGEHLTEVAEESRRWLYPHSMDDPSAIRTAAEPTPIAKRVGAPPHRPLLPGREGLVGPRR